jgi:SAM-dependent methyltransferase
MPHPRLLFACCPLCERKDFRVLRTADCSKHPLYQPAIAPAMTWMRCDACGHVFTDGYFSPATEALLFGKTNKDQEPGWDMDDQRTLSSFIVDRLVQCGASQGAWLDVGFGNGSLLFTAQEWGFEAVGVDLRRSSVEALARFGIEAHCVDITDWAQPARFGVVSMADVLEHMPFPKRALAAGKRLLKPGGLLFLSMPNYDCTLWRKLDSDGTCPYWAEIEHFHNFSRGRLYDLLNEAGFEPLRYHISLRYQVGMEVIARRRD